MSAGLLESEALARDKAVLQLPSMRDSWALSELLAGIVPEAALRRVSGVCVSGAFDDSRKVRRGSLFVAICGAKDDGRRFIPDALERGAVTVLGEELPNDLPVPAISVPSARRALAQIAARWYGVQSLSGLGVALLGVTGTNGKSTTAYMVRAILEAASIRCGLLGTVEYDLCGRKLISALTTPGPLELCSHVRECVEAWAGAIVMEASSHALSQYRVDGLKFAAAAFTNLTGDHMDYHADMAEYASAKARLFENLGSEGTAIINADDAHGARMVQKCAAKIVHYGVDRPAELSARVMREAIGGTTFKLKYGADAINVDSAMVGRHNVYNALAAAGLAAAIGVPLAKIKDGLTALRQVPGRLERVDCGLPGEVFVDYAHTDDALRNVLSVLKPLTQRRLMLVFGCGGDRDRTKRPRMAAIAEQYAGAVVVTSDNPRTEDPDQIIADIVAGFRPDMRRRVMIEPDRRAAIRCAISSICPGDVLLVAGKGHESYQIIGTQKLPFDDVDEVRRAAAERGVAPAETL